MKLKIRWATTIDTRKFLDNMQNQVDEDGRYCLLIENVEEFSVEK